MLTVCTLIRQFMYEFNGGEKRRKRVKLHESLFECKNVHSDSRYMAMLITLEVTSNLALNNFSDSGHTISINKTVGSIALLNETVRIPIVLYQ